MSLEQEKQSAGPLLRELKGDINKPLAAILTLNTIAHTVGAVGAGAQAVVVFGDKWVGADLCSSNADDPNIFRDYS